MNTEDVKNRRLRAQAAEHRERAARLLSDAAEMDALAADPACVACVVVSGSPEVIASAQRMLDHAHRIGCEDASCDGCARVGEVDRA